MSNTSLVMILLNQVKYSWFTLDIRCGKPYRI